MKIGFIGAGNMAGAIIRGSIGSGRISPADILCYDPMADKTNALIRDTGICSCASNEQLAEQADVVLLAVKPVVFEDVLSPLKAVLARKKPLICSIVTGTTLERIQAILGGAELPIVRVMPNVNAMVGAGMAAVCGNSHASRQDVELILELFDSVGMAVELPEKDFSTFTAIAGSSPAYACLFIDALARGAVKHGMAKDLATRVAAQAVLGSAKMVLEGTDSPWDIIDKVCSPGGTTVAGLLAMEEEAFLSIVAKGVDATIRRDREIMESYK